MTGPEIVARRIGAERCPIAIIDDFHPDPDALRTAALARRFEAAGRHYPGLRAAVPTDYVGTVLPLVATVLREIFALRTSADLLDASFSIVTTPRDRLTVQQRLPHVDAVAAGRIALVHYLDPAGGDGTAFFRHRATGYERIGEDRAAGFFATLNRELHDHGPPPAGYIAESSPLFERTTLIAARYNRAVLYPSALLHSGAIGADAVLSDDPATARLTITAFFAAT